MPPVNIAAHLRNRGNNFDVLRIAAATAVLVSHSFALSGHIEPSIPGADNSVGSTAVFVFFAISGFLVTRSWALQPKPRAFAVKRALRIWPALVVSVLITAFVVGPIVASNGPGGFLTSIAPWRYVAQNTLMATHYQMAGVFEHDVFPGTVNGSLGTLPAEIKAYLLLAIGAAALAAWRQRRTLPAAAGTLVFLAVAVVAMKTGVKSVHQLLPLFASFIAGGALYVLRERIPVHGAIAIAAAGGFILAYQLPEMPQAALIGVSVAYLVLFFAFRALAPLRFLIKPGDVSYGVYIYAFMVQQTIAYATDTRSPWLMTAIALPVTYVLALASWRLIEAPALTAKSRLVGASAPQRPETTLAAVPAMQQAS